jgi:hypothetical protein
LRIDGRGEGDKRHCNARKSNDPFPHDTNVPSFAFAHANASGDDQARCKGRSEKPGQ